MILAALMNAFAVAVVTTSVSASMVSIPFTKPL